MRLYHRTHDPDGVIAAGFRDGEEHMSNGGEFRRGVWFSDRPVPDAAGDATMHLVVLDIPDDVAGGYSLSRPPDQAYIEFCIPVDVANAFGRPRRDTGDGMSLADAFGVLPSGAGVIGLLSSDEFTDAAGPFDEALLGRTGGHVAVCLAADPDAAARSASLALAHYRSLGADPTVLEVLGREDARADAFPECDVVLLAGGSPLVLLRALHATPFWHKALEHWRAGRGLAGSSAGAMALCAHCTIPEPGADKPTVWSEGLGPIDACSLAVHAATRPEAWLAGITASAPVPVVSLDDATGVILSTEHQPLVVGAGKARVHRAKDA